MKIGGLMKTTLLDYPGKVACTIFTVGCNMKCPFCHNSELIEGNSSLIDEDEVLSFLKKRVGVLDGVCISGGEPTLQKDLKEFVQKLKEMGYLVKLDTNGTNPELLKELVNDHLIDYVAMDIKNSPKKYCETAGNSSILLSKIKESIEFLLEGKIEYEFRTTVVEELHEVSDFKEIGAWIYGAKAYYLQQFVDSDAVVFSGFHGCSKEKMEEFLSCVTPFVPNSTIRGM